MTWKPVIDGENINIPPKGAKVRLKDRYYMTCLSGMQMKLGMVEGCEGTVLDVQGIAETPDARAAQRPSAIEFKLKTSGGVRLVLVPFTAEGVASVEVEAP